MKGKVLEGTFVQIGLQIVILLHNGHILLLWVECVH
jgi:hypothetical protein